MPQPPTESHEDAAPPLRTLPWPVRWLLLAFAVLCLVMGIIGVIVPGLPTTVFILMAAWAAARSSPRLYRWLWNHRLFGPLLRNWAQGGKVSRRAKWSATLLMALSGIVLFATLALLVATVTELARTLLNYLFWAIILRIVLSWVSPDPRNPVTLVVTQLTEPVMAPARKLLPPMGGLDLSPILILLAIQLIQAFFRL